MVTAAFCLTGFLLIILGYMEYSSENTSYETETVMSYEITPKIDYRFKLIPNSIYSQRYLDANQVIALNLVEAFEAQVDFVAVIRGADEVELNLVQIEKLETYFGSDEDIIWEKVGEKKIFPFYPHHEKENQWYAEFSNPLHWNQFDAFQERAQEESGVTGRPHFVTHWHLEGSILHEHGETTIDHVYSMKVPLGAVVWEPSEEKLESLSDSVTFTREVTIPTNLPKVYMTFALGGILLILALLAGFKINIKEELSLYQKNKQRHFKRYEDRLVALNAIPHGGFFNLIAVKTMEDLVKIADEIRQPIYYHELESTQDYKIEYYVFDKEKSYYLIDFDVKKGEKENEV